MTTVTKMNAIAAWRGSAESWVFVVTCQWLRSRVRSTSGCLVARRGLRLKNTESPPFLRTATERLHDILPHSRIHEIAGQRPGYGCCA